MRRGRNAFPISQEHLCDIDRGAGADIVKMLIEPFADGVPSCVA
jgi:hypothetical protein